MTRCPSCDHDNRPDRRFCTECGAVLSVVCPSCGAPTEAGEKFCGGCGARLPTVAPATGAPTPTPEPDAAVPAGERRQLTVLFCDLVGSTPLSQQLDAEEWRDIIAQYQQAASGAVVRFGGHVARKLGDGLLIYFGWPTAREDDPERAVRAGLAIVDAMVPLNATLAAGDGPRLAVRIGLHTGPVVIADGGEVFGETANVAARVQGAAEPDTAVITEATHRLVAGRFIVEAKGAPPLKGVRTPVTLYRVVQPSGVRSRLALAAGRLTRFVGREVELATLIDRWARAQDGEGQTVVVLGEAGIGKSRLVYQLHEHLTAVPHTWLECGATPYTEGTPFHPVIALVSQGLTFAPGETAAEQLGKLEVGLRTLASAEAVALLADFLGLPPPTPLQMSPELQRRKTIDLLAQWSLALSAVQPLVMVVEDLHWCDASTLELLGHLIAQSPTARVLLLASARPEFTPPWPARSNLTTVQLARLTKRQARDMIAALAGTELPAATFDALVARADGVPLYVEELTKGVLEPGVAGRADAIPPTLADSLMARLDRLGGAKEVAQVGAVIGREFSYALLHAVSPLPEAELQAALARLADAELLYPRGLPPEATYVFKHALVRDTAYASLLKSRRRELHGAIARVLAERFHDTAETQPELLAVHYTEGGEAEPAVAAWQRAGEQAFGRGALAEAVSHLRRGLAVLATLPASPAHGEQEFRLQLSLGEALMVTTGYASPETAEAFARARALSANLRDDGKLVAPLFGLTVSALTRDGPLAAQPLADQTLAAAEQAGRPSLLVTAHSAQACARFLAGDLAGAREHCRRALALSDETTQLSARPTRIVALMYASWTTWLLGRAAEARGLEQEAVAQAERAGRPPDRASVELHAAWLHILLRELTAVREHAERAACAEAEGTARPSGTLMIFRGWALAEEGQTEEGLAAVRVGLERFAASGQRHALEFHLGLLADVHACAGNVADALAVLAAAEGALPGEEVWRADTLRRRAELLARAGADTVTVEATFRDALTVARRQGAKAYELRAGTRYGLFLRAHGRAAEARDLLAPIYGWFTEGFDTRDLQEAQALLEELR